MHNIAVIGAGIAGLAAARELDDSGVRVQLFDKGRGPGGRMSTKMTDHGAFDLGAQYFSVRDDEFAALIDSAQCDGVVTAWPRRMARLDDSGWQQRTPRHPRYCGAPSMQALPRYLARGLEIASGVAIESLVSDGNGWALLTRHGERYSGFDRVLLAIPGPQARQLAAAHLPPGAPGDEQIAMTPCWSSWLRLARPLTEGDWQGLSLDGSPVLRWAARYQSRGDTAPNEGRGGERLSLLADADWSAANLERERDEIAAEMTAAFADCLGTLPAVVAQGAHRWRYAQPRRAGQSESGYHHCAAQRLTLCGDWCLDGRVEAAWLSGRRAARRLMVDLSQ